MGLTFESLHWGDPARSEVDTSVLVDCRATPIGEVDRLSYAAQKEGRPAVWRHRFAERDDQAGELRRPYLLEEDRRGPLELGGIPRDTLAVGVGVDLELEGGDRVLLAECWVVTDPSGEYCQIAFTSPVPVALEQHGQWVTDDGIEG
jgi:hypothetical protein